MILYSITHGPRGFMLAKFDEDFNVAAVYNVNNHSCDCPAGHRPTCKHRKMLPRMLSKVDSGEFYCYETQTWHEPLGDLLRPEAGDLEGREAMPVVNGEAVAGAAVGSEDKIEGTTPSVVIIDECQDELTAGDIEALPDGAKKDFHHVMQEAPPPPPQPTMLIRRR